MLPGCRAPALDRPGSPGTRPFRSPPSSLGGIQAYRPGLPLTPCAVTRDQLHGQGRQARSACTTHEDPSSTATEDDPVVGMSEHSSRTTVVHKYADRTGFMSS